ncbi:hypothetical protein AGR8A_pTi20163 [Agrobacterium fabrum str. J-07]|nr:hypothetical protein AGR8A_pTi20163 [Agrobacterium fabrum str. J-07]
MEIHIVGPTPVSAARLDKFVATNIHHLPCKSPDSPGNLLVHPASLKIQPVQWGGDGTYVWMTLLRIHLVTN